jgi:hypothetical protein
VLSGREARGTRQPEILRGCFEIWAASSHKGAATLPRAPRIHSNDILGSPVPAPATEAHNFKKF